MVHAANKEKYSSLREQPLKNLIDRPHISAYLFLRREDDDDVRDIGNNTSFVRFYFTPCYLMLSNARDVFVGAVKRIEGKGSRFQTKFFK